jgi:hypothetical protein
MVQSKQRGFGSLIPALFRQISLWSLLVALFAGCVPLFKGIQSTRDVIAPVITGYRQIDQRRIEIDFSEAVFAAVEDFTVEAEGSIIAVSTGTSSIGIEIEGWNEPGRAYRVEGQVNDKQGNSIWFSLPFYGFNENPAHLAVNEFINENSSTRYEKAELLVVQGGNLGGISVYNGTPAMFRSMMTFADQEVYAGEYLVIHFRYQEEEADVHLEVDEYDGVAADCMNAAASTQATSDVRDFWVRGYQGLSDSNGAISIADSPYADSAIMDAVAWSDRFWDPEAKYSSFGTSYTEQVMLSLLARNGWSWPNDELSPEGCIRTENSTSTRSMNRMPGGEDMDLPSDWHICPTGMSSFGYENSIEVHTP